MNPSFIDYEVDALTTTPLRRYESWINGSCLSYHDLFIISRLEQLKSKMESVTIRQSDSDTESTTMGPLKNVATKIVFSSNQY